MRQRECCDSHQCCDRCEVSFSDRLHLCAYACAELQQCFDLQLPWRAPLPYERQKREQRVTAAHFQRAFVARDTLRKGLLSTALDSLTRVTLVVRRCTCCRAASRQGSAHAGFHVLQCRALRVRNPSDGAQ